MHAPWAVNFNAFPLDDGSAASSRYVRSLRQQGREHTYFDAKQCRFVHNLARPRDCARLVLPDVLSNNVAASTRLLETYLDGKLSKILWQKQASTSIPQSEFEAHQFSWTEDFVSL